MGNEVTYTITMDKNLFPFAPGSKVVVRGCLDDKWKKEIFLIKNNKKIFPYRCKDDCFSQCYPFDTHSHLLGTTYPADTPVCPQCGKAIEPNNGKWPRTYVNKKEVCSSCYDKYLSVGEPYIILADRKIAFLEDIIWHPEKGKCVVKYIKPGNIVGALYDYNSMVFLTGFAFYSQQCAKLATGKVIMKLEPCWHPIHGEGTAQTEWGDLRFVGGSVDGLHAKLSVCYPIGSCTAIPKEDKD